MSVASVVAHDCVLPGSDEEKDQNESSNGRGYSPGRIIIENGVLYAEKNGGLSSASDVSLPELGLASPESDSLVNVLTRSSSSADSGPLSARSDSVSDEVPLELGALSQTRQTPPPSLTQLNFRKRRSRGTPKRSPKLKMLAEASLGLVKAAEEKPPKKVAKLQGENEQETEVCETTETEMKSTSSQTDAQFVEDDSTANLTPRKVIIRAVARSRSESCLASPTRKSVSFVTKDDYVSEGEEVDEALLFSAAARKRLSKVKRRFQSRGQIDVSKITDSLKLLRLKLGLDPEGFNLDGGDAKGEDGDEVDEKERHSALTTIKKKFMRKLTSTPLKDSKSKEDFQSSVGGQGSISATGITVTADNCSTTALRGSPLSTRSSSVTALPDVQESVSAEGLLHSPDDDASVSTPDADDSDKTALLPDASAEPGSNSDGPQPNKWHFFQFAMPTKKVPKSKMQPAKNQDVITTGKCIVAPLDELDTGPEKSYFQALDNMGKMSPAIRNISSKYKLFAAHPSKPIENQSDEGNDSAAAKQNVVVDGQNSGENPEEAGTTTTSKVNASLSATNFSVEKDESDAGWDAAGTPPSEDQLALEHSPETYAPNEGDLNKPLIKRTKKSTNIVVEKAADIEARKQNVRKASPQKKKLPKKSGSITQRIRRIWQSHEKVTKSEHALDTTSSDKQHGTQLDVSCGTVASGLHTANDETQANRSASAPIYPVSPSASLVSSTDGSPKHTSSEESPSASDVDKPTLAAKLDTPAGAMFCPGGAVRSTRSENDSFNTTGSHGLMQNVPPVIKRKDFSQPKTINLSGSSTSSLPEPYLMDEDANLDYPALSQAAKNILEGKEPEKEEKVPRRVTPTPVPAPCESMHMGSAVDAQAEGMFFNPSSSCNENVQIMHCQIQQQNQGFFSPDDCLDVIFGPSKFWGQSQDCLDAIFGPSKLLDQSQECHWSELHSQKNRPKNTNLETFRSRNLSTSAGKKVRWGRSYSAPPGKFHSTLKRSSRSCEHENGALADVCDSSLDKWDMIKMTLEEAENQPFRFRDHHSLDRHRRSLSDGSVSSTDSASEGRDMETGDCELSENEAVYGGSGLMKNPQVIAGGNLSELRERDAVNGTDSTTPCGSFYQSASMPSPAQDGNFLPVHFGISSSLSNSLSGLDTLPETPVVGVSGEKRKQCEVATPTKDEQPGRKVRLESPESDEDGPPRVRKVFRSKRNVLE